MKHRKSMCMLALTLFSTGVPCQGRGATQHTVTLQQDRSPGTWSYDHERGSDAVSAAEAASIAKKLIGLFGSDGALLPPGCGPEIKSDFVADVSMLIDASKRGGAGDVAFPAWVSRLREQLLLGDMSAVGAGRPWQSSVFQKEMVDGREVVFEIRHLVESGVSATRELRQYANKLDSTDPAITDDIVMTAGRRLMEVPDLVRAWNAFDLVMMSVEQVSVDSSKPGDRQRSSASERGYRLRSALVEVGRLPKEAARAFCFTKWRGVLVTHVESGWSFGKDGTVTGVVAGNGPNGQPAYRSKAEWRQDGSLMSLSVEYYRPFSSLALSRESFSNIVSSPSALGRLGARFLQAPQPCEITRVRERLDGVAGAKPVDVKDLPLVLERLLGEATKTTTR